MLQALCGSYILYSSYIIYIGFGGFVQYVVRGKHVCYKVQQTPNGMVQERNEDITRVTQVRKGEKYNWHGGERLKHV